MLIQDFYFTKILNLEMKKQLHLLKQKIKYEISVE
jgi:hypothetical protein